MANFDAILIQLKQERDRLNEAIAALVRNRKPLRAIPNRNPSLDVRLRPSQDSGCAKGALGQSQRAQSRSDHQSYESKQTKHLSGWSRKDRRGSEGKRGISES